MELNSTLLTFFLTVTGGVLTFVAGQIAIKLFVEPIQEQAKTIGKIHYSLMFYRNKYTNLVEVDSPAALDLSKHLRDQASQLRANTNAIRWYFLWSLLRLVPKRKNAMEASKAIMTLSYFQTKEVDAFEKSEKAAQLLKLELDS